MLDYLEPETRLTLRDALSQLRLEDAKDRDIASTIALEVERSMTAHDAVHVIFACDTSDQGEAIAHAWMLLGTDVTHHQLREVIGTRDHKAFAREIGHVRRLLALLTALSAVAVGAATTLLLVLHGQALATLLSDAAPDDRAERAVAVLWGGLDPQKVG